VNQPHPELSLFLQYLPVTHCYVIQSNILFRMICEWCRCVRACVRACVRSSLQWTESSSSERRGKCPSTCHENPLSNGLPLLSFASQTPDFLRPPAKCAFVTTHSIRWNWTRFIRRGKGKDHWLPFIALGGSKMEGREAWKNGRKRLREVLSAVISGWYGNTPAVHCL